MLCFRRCVSAIVNQIASRGFFLCVLAVMAVHAFAKTRAKPGDGPPIVCPSRPKDSRGETVYKNQGPDEKDQPVIAGKLVLLRPFNLLPAPPRLRGHPGREEVIVEGVAER